MTGMRAWSPGQWALRGVVVAGVAVALLALGRPGDALPLAGLVVGLALAVCFAVRPESAAGLLTLGYVVVLAGLRVRHHVDATALAVAAGLLVAHLAAALSAYTPERATPDAGLVRLWALRAPAVLVPAVVAWAAVSVTGGGLWLVGAVLVLAAVVAVTAVVSESAPS